MPLKTFHIIHNFLDIFFYINMYAYLFNKTQWAVFKIMK